MKLKYIGAYRKTFPVGDLEPGAVFTVLDQESDSYLLRTDVITAEDEKPRRKRSGVIRPYSIPDSLQEVPTAPEGSVREEEAVEATEGPSEAP